VIRQFEISLLCDAGLKFLDRFIVKLFDLAAMDTDQMVMVVAAIQFEDGISPLEVVSNDESCGLKLSEYPVNGRKANFFSLADQCLEDIFRA
jgi:hypothetical protein